VFVELRHLRRLSPAVRMNLLAADAVHRSDLLQSSTRSEVQVLKRNICAASLLTASEDLPDALVADHLSTVTHVRVREARRVAAPDARTQGVLVAEGALLPAQQVRGPLRHRAARQVRRPLSELVCDPTRRVLIREVRLFQCGKKTSRNCLQPFGYPSQQFISFESLEESPRVLQQLPAPYMLV